MFTGNHIYRISELPVVGVAAAMLNSKGGGGKYASGSKKNK